MQNKNHSFLGAVGLCFLVLITGFGIGIVFAILQSVTKLNLDAKIITAIGNSASFGLAIWIGLKISEKEYSEVLRLNPFKPLEALSFAITAIGFSFLLSEVDNLFSMLVPKPDFIINLFQGLFDGENIFLSVILLSVVAPITEELMFRGVILDRLLKYFSVTSSFLISSLLFGLIHLNPWQFIGSSILGIYMAWVVYKTNSIWNSILIHAVFNGIPLIVLHGLQLEIPGFSAPIAGKIQVLQPLWLDLLGLLITCFGLSLTFFLFRNRNEKIA
ncbi:CPBP family intramembrane metalloprotease [Leptospira selangorensis]|uniref:CPBP family intramembrane metalloprotease n=1 Tax=Leptospira selangorensis TaxID=2484982 RepID=A0A5F2C6N6_9LEPT|nr:type II CAAX endopeptidase family protein [Leptospira selangorensis]TGM12703.1 CPBP family intramembrane metalloprotease [Leptospira selangorensis]TGM30764.1 CPBP family intramembrane metalloprotease [Leptospira selangorensis]